MMERVVLCVDDESIILLAVKQSLRRELGAGWRCEIAPGGEAGLAALAALHDAGAEVAAVVSDWRMPGMTGDVFLRAVRSRWPSIRLFLMTGYAEREMVEALHAELDLAGRLGKPCDMRKLAGLIRADGVPA